MSLTAKVAGLALATAVVSVMVSPSFADTFYRNGPIKSGDMCWATVDHTRVYGYWRACPSQTAAKPKSSGQVAAQGNFYRNGPIRSGDKCWAIVDHTRVYGYWRDCPAQAKNTVAKRGRRG